jgi:hypothetical protein
MHRAHLPAHHNAAASTATSRAERQKKVAGKRHLAHQLTLFLTLPCWASVFLNFDTEPDFGSLYYQQHSRIALAYPPLSCLNNHIDK